MESAVVLNKLSSWILYTEEKNKQKVDCATTIMEQQKSTTLKCWEPKWWHGEIENSIPPIGLALSIRKYSRNRHECDSLSRRSFLTASNNIIMINYAQFLHKDIREALLNRKIYAHILIEEFWKDWAWHPLQFHNIFDCCSGSSIFAEEVAMLCNDAKIRKNSWITV